MDKEKEDITSKNDEEQENLKPAEDDETPKTPSDEELEKLRKQAELAENYRIRAEKAEKKLKETPVPKEAPKEKQEKKGLSDEDLIYIARTDIHDEDLPEVREYAEWKGVSIREAHLKMKPILDERAEERRTAEATNTKSPRGTSKVSGEKILADAQRGKLPDADDVAGIDALTSAHLAAKTPKRK